MDLIYLFNFDFRNTQIKVLFTQIFGTFSLLFNAFKYVN